MDFAVMGTVSSYVKLKNLNFAAKHKLKTGQTLVNSNGNFISSTSTFDKLREAAKSANNQAKAQKLARIRQKLRGGQKLSDEEMGFLRVNDPKTYKKAKDVEEAREELKSELKKAKSKSEAREAVSRAMIKASSSAMSELSGLGQGDSTCAGGSINGASMNFSENAPANVTGGEISAQNVNFQSANTNFGGENTQSPLNTQTNSDSDKNSPEDIMEKYLWTIRAIQDEFKRFTDSDDYKNLPDNLVDEVIDKKIIRRTQKFIDAASAYRKSMNFKKNFA